MSGPSSRGPPGPGAFWIGPGYQLPGGWPSPASVKVYCDMTVDEAAAVADEAMRGLPDTDGEVPNYELWRERIRKRFE